MARPDLLDVLPYADTCDDDATKLPFGEAGSPATGWASVKGGRWHRTVGGDPADFRTPVVTVCRLTITPFNVGADNVNSQNVCKWCAS